MNIGSIRQKLDGGYKIQTLMLHDKVDDIATSSTPKTVVDLLVWTHTEGWCLLVMKRATTKKVTPRALELDII